MGNNHDYELMHYGVKGMKWGVRRYQNADGSYTKAGQRRNAKIIKNLRKNNSYRLGGAVGKDATITSAADEVRSFARKLKNAEYKSTKILNKRESEDWKKYSDFYRKNGRDPTKKEFESIKQSTYKKYKKDIENSKKEEDKARTEYNTAVKQVLNKYLGQYANTPIKDIHGNKLTAAEELARQMLWGNMIRKE